MVRKEGRSHRVSVKHNLRVVRFFTRKSEKNILLEDFTNCHVYGGPELPQSKFQKT